MVVRQALKGLLPTKDGSWEEVKADALQQLSLQRQPQQQHASGTGGSSRSSKLNPRRRQARRRQLAEQQQQQQQGPPRVVGAAVDAGVSGQQPEDYAAGGPEPDPGSASESADNPDS